MFGFWHSMFALQNPLLHSKDYMFYQFQENSQKVGRLPRAKQKLYRQKVELSDQKTKFKNKLRV